MEVITSLVPYQVGDFPCQRFDVVAIIDVLRATTTLLFAVKAEAKRIIPVATVDEAFEIKYELTSENVLLCGERGGKIVPGFDLGNSPLEYTPERVKGKTLIYASTNGSVLMRRAESLSDKIFLVSLRNIMAAADRIVSAAPKRMLIACAGKEGMS
ncbi:2-phosphosulfolactate phosphatase, partial [bacterium]|nr:2-phosphosulfolactate phosphatase [bacterium]